MNIHNNDIDPFEDVFRDRFSDFESEPDTQLWQKIEPKLPVDATRKFPYWQTSSVVILLLAGLWIYREKNSGDGVMKSNDNETIAESHGSRPFEGRLPYSANNSLTVNDLEKNTTNNIIVKSEGKTSAHEPSVQTHATDTESVIPTQEGTVISAKNKIEVTKISSSRLGVPIRQDDKSVEIVGEINSPIFSNHNATFETSKTSFDKTIENIFSKNNNSILNPFTVNNSNKKQEIISENLSNNSSVSSVFSNKENVSALGKNILTSLDSKEYSLLRNHFKTPKLKFVAVPKKDDYFKERKPLEMYVSVMPLLNYYTITPNGNDANFVHSIAVNGDEDRLGFYTQAGVVFTLSDKFKLRTGLTFTKTNHSINYQVRTDSLIVQPSDRQGVDVSFEELKKTYSQSANYLGTKIEVQYTFLEGEALSHYVNVGLEGAYRLNGGNQFNGFANFAYGVTRQIGDNAYLFVEPTFSYSLNQQSDNNSFLLVKPNKIGFNIGVNFKIK